MVGHRRFWLALLELDPSESSPTPPFSLGLETFLAVYSAYDPDASLIGIREGFLSIGLLEGKRVTEGVFREWMAIMFAGCSQDEVRYGYAVLLNAAAVVKEGEGSGAGLTGGREPYRYTDLVSHAEAVSPRYTPPGNTPVHTN